MHFTKALPVAKALQKEGIGGSKEKILQKMFKFKPGFLYPSLPIAIRLGQMEASSPALAVLIQNDI